MQKSEDKFKAGAALNNQGSVLLAIFKWFLQPGYPQGVFWSIMISVVSVSNDLIMNALGNSMGDGMVNGALNSHGKNMHTTQIAFFRFLFGTLWVLPIMLKSGTKLFKTTQPAMHFWRAIVGALALFLWCVAVNILPLATNTTIILVQPIIFLIMAFFILKEHVNKQRWIATLAGFLGLLVIIKPGTNAFQVLALIPLLSAVLFAVLDIMAKTMIREENS